MPRLGSMLAPLLDPQLPRRFNSLRESRAAIATGISAVIWQTGRYPLELTANDVIAGRATNLTGARAADPVHPTTCPPGAVVERSFPTSMHPHAESRLAQLSRFDDPRPSRRHCPGGPSVNLGAPFAGFHTQRLPDLFGLCREIEAISPRRGVLRACAPRRAASAVGTGLTHPREFREESPRKSPTSPNCHHSAPTTSPNCRADTLVEFRVLNPIAVSFRRSPRLFVDGWAPLRSCELNRPR